MPYFLTRGVQTKFEAFCGGASSGPCGVVSPWYESESWGGPSPPRISPPNRFTQLSAQFIQRRRSLCLFVCLFGFLITWSCFVLLQIPLLGVAMVCVCMHVCVYMCAIVGGGISLHACVCLQSGLSVWRWSHLLRHMADHSPPPDTWPLARKAIWDLVI